MRVSVWKKMVRVMITTNTDTLVLQQTTQANAWRLTAVWRSRAVRRPCCEVMSPRCSSVPGTPSMTFSPPGRSHSGLPLIGLCRYKCLNDILPSWYVTQWSPLRVGIVDGIMGRRGFCFSCQK